MGNRPVIAWHFPSSHCVLQARYHEKWYQVLHAAFAYYRDHAPERSGKGPGASDQKSAPFNFATPPDLCRNCTGKREADNCIIKVFLRLGQGVSSLLPENLASTFAVECDWAEARVKTWYEFVEGRVRKIPAFDTFL